jgi:hypothetical protein
MHDTNFSKNDVLVPNKVGFLAMAKTIRKNFIAKYVNHDNLDTHECMIQILAKTMAC